MEKTSKDALFRVRSSRSCVRKGCQLYLSNFRRIVKASWLPATLFAVCVSILGTIAVIQYPRLNLTALVNPDSMPLLFDNYMVVFAVSLLAFIVGGLMESATYSCMFRLLAEHKDTGVIPISKRLIEFSRQWAWRTIKAFLGTLLLADIMAIIVTAIVYGITVGINKMGGETLISSYASNMAAFFITLVFAAPLFHVVIKYILTPNAKFWPSAWSSYRDGFRHLGIIITSLIMATLVISLVSAVICLPAIVVAIANFQANLGLLFGDPLGMPSYIVPLTAIAMAFAGFVEVMTRSVVFFITYYIYGSIETQENEKNKFNKEIQNI